jgi:hypothetical protein
MQIHFLQQIKMYTKIEYSFILGTCCIVLFVIGVFILRFAYHNGIVLMNSSTVHPSVESLRLEWHRRNSVIPDFIPDVA